MDHTNINVLALSLCIAYLTGCGSGSVNERESNNTSNQTSVPKITNHSAWFQDMTDLSGIHFLNLPDHENSYFMPNSVGAGAGVIDVNKDGLLDIYFLRMTSKDTDQGNQLFVQQDDGRFLDQTKEFGLGVKGYFHGIAVGDLNNDGFQDIVLTEYKGIQIFQNQSGKTFKNITSDVGIENPAWGTSVALTDYNVDGWLDILVANYVQYDPLKECVGDNGEPEYCGPHNFPGTVSRLFRNSGDLSKIQFEDVTSKSGLALKPGPALGVTCMDFTGDGLVDFLLADDMRPNRLFVNQGDQTFKEEAALRGIAVDGVGQAKADMGIGIADVDRNGLMDVFITHLRSENHTLWMQEPAGIYTDKTAFSGLMKRQWKGTAFGTVLIDFDNDTWPDLAMVNGSIRRNEFDKTDYREDVTEFYRPYAQRAQLYQNLGRGKFIENTDRSPDFTQLGNVGRGLLAADLDNDGDVDLISTPVGSPALLFRNVIVNKGAWLGVSVLLPEQGGRYAHGAVIDIEIGSKVYRSIVHSGYSYLCANDPRVLVGLGTANRYDRILVTWPDQVKEAFGGGEVNQYIEIFKGSGEIISSKKQENRE